MSQSDFEAPARKGALTGKLTLIAFIALVWIGGSNAVAVKFSNLELPPFWGAALRFLVTAAVFWLIVLLRRASLPTRLQLLGTSLYGVATGASYAFIYWALLKVPASLTMVILSLGPLLTMVFAALHGLERFRWRGLLGALIALSGIALAVGQDLGEGVPLLSLLALLAGAACIAEGSIAFKLFPKPGPLATNAVSTSIAAMLLVIVSLIAGEAWALPTSSTTWGAFTYLVVVGSVVLFYFYLFVLTRWTASATSYGFLLFPVATAIIAAWFFDEAITPRFVGGGLVALFGVWIGALKKTGIPTGAEQPKPTPDPSLPPRPDCA